MIKSKYSDYEWNYDEEYERWYSKALCETNKENLTIDLLMIIHSQCRVYFTRSNADELLLSNYVEALLNKLDNDTNNSSN